jgi:glutathione synthase
MKLGLVVNNVLTEKADYTTTLIAMAAMSRGHDVYYISLDRLSYVSSDRVCVKANSVPQHNYHSHQTFIRALHSDKVLEQRITLDDLDILWLRNDPAEDVIKRPWARLAGINFARLAMRHGVLVLNDPYGLNIADNKIYLQSFPEAVRPRAIITRDPTDIKHFINQEGGYVVLKPLSGSGGHNVFLITPEEKVNLNQIIEVISEEGFIIAQEYLPKAVNGDIRLFLVNGHPLKNKNKIAALHRYRKSNDDDMRSNITAGAIAKQATVSKEMLEIAEIVRPKLVQDGLFFVGLDIVGDKLMEINVFSPGGLDSCERFEKAKFAQQIIIALERKVHYIKHYQRHFINKEIAML